MGIAFFDSANNRIVVRSFFHFYGDAATAELSVAIAEDIGRYWNEAEGKAAYKSKEFPVFFDIKAFFRPDLTEGEVLRNIDPANNYFRIEEYCFADISFVDGINCNTGYFKLANLLHTGSTAAHEYGHTIGLEHPAELNGMGQGVPGIMYPRGSWVDAEFQYFPDVKPGEHGGTINPIYRKVKKEDLANLHLAKKLARGSGYAILGDFSSVWHDKHEVESAF